MTNKEYRFKFYLNARHTMDISDSVSKIHPHTWEFNLFFKKNCEEFIQFTKVEKELQFFLSIYEGYLLNEIPPFDILEPSLENIGTTLYEQIKRIMGANSWILLRLEVSENPSRTYILYESDGDSFSGSNNNSNNGHSSQNKKRMFKLGSHYFMRYRESQKNESSDLFPNDEVLKSVVNGRNIINFPQNLTRNMDNLNEEARIVSIDGDMYAEYVSKEGQEAIDSFQDGSYTSSMETLCSTVEAADYDLYNTINKEVLNNDEYICCTTEEAAVLSFEAEVEPIGPVNDSMEIAPCVENCGVVFVSRKDRKGKGNIKNSPSPKTPKPPAIKHLKRSPLFRNIIIILIAAGILITYITSRGSFPWGSDTWGHLFKAHLLYEEFMKGNIYPLYTELWYNGIQPFRYWAPLPYYILMFFEVIAKGNTILAYNLFITVSFIAGALGWILWGVKTGRNNLALALALLWFFMPDNARVLFSEGNIPRVVVSNIFPFLLLYCWEYVEKHKKQSFVMISLCMLLITLSHAMIAAMVAITITIFLIIYGILERKKRLSIEAIFAVIIGITLSAVWLYPALKGGIFSLDSEAVGNVMESLTFPISQSLNPYIRLSNSEIYYFGLSIFIISALGIMFGEKKSKAGFIVTIVILLGTTKALLFLFQKIPMSQLFWMMRFTPLAYGVFFVGLFMWKKIRKVIVLAMIILLIADCWISVKVLCMDVPPPINLSNAISPAIDIASQRIAVLDNSEFGSFPSYDLAYNDKDKAISQVYGWAWQGAKTSENIVWINTALEKGWYTFLFDRCLELGADTIVVKKDKITNKYDFFARALEVGYMEGDETPLSYILKYPVNSLFGTKVTYTGMCIGKYAANLSYMFPNMEVGSSEYLDSYSMEELAEYKVLFLSGFKYKDKVKAEKIVKEISQRGTKVIIDMTGTERELGSSRSEFLNVRSQLVLIKDAFPKLEYDSQKLILSEIPDDYKNWSTIYLENLDNSLGKIEFENQYMDFLGSKGNENITFIGLNIPFYSLLTKDQRTIAILEDIMGMKAGEKPLRSIVKVNMKEKGNVISIYAKEQGTITGIANLDAFDIAKGSISEIHNLVKVESSNVEIRITYPYLKGGLAISTIGIIMMGAFLIIPARKVRGSIEHKLPINI
jgi:6-pyruvoyl tetrahydropterin synthase-like protein